MKVQGIELVKSFGNPPQEVLHGISLEIQKGEFVALTGRSGSGKSTLLYLLSTLDSPTRGEVFLDGVSSSFMTPSEVHALRNQKMGFVFQFHYLLPDLTSLENILLPARKTGQDGPLQGRALELLRAFGLEDKAGRRPSELSGGEQQRIAIARALILKPSLIFADEPTGNLDTSNGQLVMDLLKKINQEEGSTLILITHDQEFAKEAPRRIHLVDGRIEADPGSA